MGKVQVQEGIVYRPPAQRWWRQGRMRARKKERPEAVVTVQLELELQSTTQLGLDMQQTNEEEHMPEPDFEEPVT